MGKEGTGQGGKVANAPRALRKCIVKNLRTLPALEKPGPLRLIG